jgi:hypothetical protein
MFPDTPDTFDPTIFQPLTYTLIIHKVLVPETAVRLIQEDLGLTSGLTVLQDSYQLGLVLHPQNDDCKFFSRAVELITESHRRGQAAVKLWEASGTKLDFESWMQQEKVTEEQMPIKSEPIEHQIPVKSAQEVIDLTLEDD